MPDLLTNQGTGTVTAGGLTAPTAGTSEAWTVTAVNAFPAVAAGRGTTFKFMDQAQTGEIMMATAAPGGTGAAQAWTVTRGAEGSIPVIHVAGFTIMELITAGTLAAALGSVQAIAPGSSPAAAASWINVTPPSGWSGTLRYKLLAEANRVVIDYALTHTALGAKTSPALIALPAAYRPAAGVTLPCTETNNTAVAAPGPSTFVGVGGVVTAFNVDTGSTGIDCHADYPLD